MTKVSNCTCRNVGQDKLHGNTNRVFNVTKKGTTEAPMYRCTVCNIEKKLK